jgi:arginase
MTSGADRTAWGERVFGLLGAPTAAGAHSPGVEKGPAALRAAGLLERLRDAGLTVHDRGDLPVEPFRLDRAHPRAPNGRRVAKVARAVADRAGSALRTGELPLIVGGDCTVLLGVLAAAQGDHVTVTRTTAGVVYLDSHPDLNTPGTASGALDWMGMAHAMAVPGALRELVELGSRAPLLAWHEATFLSYVPSELTEAERLLLDEHRPLQYPYDQVAGRARESAALAAGSLADRVDAFFVHLDVDVLDFAQFPIADNAYLRNQGLSIEDLTEALGALAAHPAFAGLVVAQVNPDHAAGQGTVLEEFCDRLAAALSSQRPKPDAS